MRVNCPECGARLEGEPGAEMVCPACMTPFVVPAASRAIRSFDVQTNADIVVHGLSRHAIREAIYVGRVDGAARVRHDGGAWELIGGYPEFAAVLRLLGGDLGTLPGTRKLAGWGRTGPGGDEAPVARPNGAAGARPVDPPPHDEGPRAPRPTVPASAASGALSGPVSDRRAPASDGAPAGPSAGARGAVPAPRPASSAPPGPPQPPAPPAPAVGPPSKEAGARGASREAPPKPLKLLPADGPRSKVVPLLLVFGTILFLGTLLLAFL